VTSGRLSVLSVFSGAGGLDLGLEAAGYETIACIERDKYARETLTKNRPQWNVLDEPDALVLQRTLTPSALGLAERELDVLAGGPPCQPFSKAAQWAPRGRAGLRDPRARTLSAFTRLVERFLPRVVLIENVPGFVLGPGSALKKLSRELERINKLKGTRYSARAHTLDAKDYGVPQSRRRALVVATRDGETLAWPSISAKAPVRAIDAIGSLRPDTLPPLRGKWAHLLASIPAGSNYLFHTPSGGGEPHFGERRRFWSFLLKLDPGRPAWTLSASPGPSTGPFHWENRPLAIEEMLAIQTFPTDWKVAGSFAAQVRQVGNATPPLLAEIIGRAIASQLFGRSFRTSLKHAVKRTRSALPALLLPAPPKVPAKSKLPTPHPGEGKGPQPRVSPRPKSKQRASKFMASTAHARAGRGVPDESR